MPKQAIYAISGAQLGYKGRFEAAKTALALRTVSCKASEAHRLPCKYVRRYRVSALHRQRPEAERSWQSECKSRS